MITSARIRDDLKPAGLDWISCLRAPAIKALAESGPLQLSLFDERDLAEVSAPEFPGERLIVCRNPDLAAERVRKREELLAATEIIRERINAGLARAKANGVKLGRPKVTPEVERKARRKLAKGTGVLKTATLLGIGTGTVQRIKAEMLKSAAGAVR
jgi:hypothetical protein